MTSVYLFDTGPFQPVPGIATDFRYSLLPFWGDYCLLDFMVASFQRGGRRGNADSRSNGGRGSKASAVEVTILLEESPRGIPLSISARWKKPVARVQALEGGLPAFAALLASSPAETVILASLSCVCMLDAEALLDKASAAGSQLAKISVGRTPIEMYFCRKDTLVKLLTSAASRAAAAGRMRETLFKEALFPSIDVIEDVEGEILFQNDLMEYCRRNLWIIANCESREYAGMLARLPKLADRGAESHISEKGFIRNSWIASGVEVEGVVEDSIIFPNVQVRKDAVVSRSLVLNGNRIGEGAEVTNALILPLTAELPRPAANIGDGCSIGARTSTMKNARFPDSIRDGLTVIGMNAEIPGGLRVEAAACIGPGVPSSLLRRMKVVKKGTSVFGNRSAELQGAEDAAT